MAFSCFLSAKGPGLFCLRGQKEGRGRERPGAGGLLWRNSPLFSLPSAEQSGELAERDGRVCKDLLRRGSFLALYGTKWEWERRGRPNAICGAEWEGVAMCRRTSCSGTFRPLLPIVCGAEWGREKWGSRMRKAYSGEVLHLSPLSAVAAQSGGHSIFRPAERICDF